MLKQIIILVLGLFLLTGCSDNVKGHFKKFANKNTKELKDGKRKPLYNEKYISIAKKNIVEANFDSDEDDLENRDSEIIHPSLKNRQIYLNMIKKSTTATKDQKFKNENNKFPSLNIVNKTTANNNNKEDRLQKELLEIKALLKETNKFLAKHCTIQPNTSHNVNKSSLKQQKLNHYRKNNMQDIDMTKIKAKLKPKFLSADDDISGSS